ncbi:MAG: peptidylprolyl isomerase [Rhodocyclaceae bacterium]|nr:peptidylprolyl isomerase [Rhodocyclaceae bacterium]
MKIKIYALLILAGLFCHRGAVAADSSSVEAVEPLYALVNGKPITQKGFDEAYVAHVRQKYYHGQIPENRLQEAKKEVGDRLVNRILLLEEAAKRGLTVDEEQIAKKIADYEARYVSSEMWQKNRERLLPGLKQQLSEQQLVDQIEKIGRAFPEPSAETVKAYYESHLELFVEPEKTRLHTILLRVDPSAPKAAWDAAREEAQRILDQVGKGTAFEELARLHSNDHSAESGGDMGYVHRGMIPEQVQQQIDNHPLGTVTKPIDVLEGVAVFRLDERIAAKQMSFAEVAGRARDLFVREEARRVWDAFMSDLRARATLQFFEPAPAAN